MLFVTDMPKDAQSKMYFTAIQLFTSKGYQETSVLDIVEGARVSKTTFYQYFGTKEGLLVSLCQSLMEEIIQEVEIAVSEEERVTYKAFAGISRYINICTARREVAQLLLVTSVGVSPKAEKVRRDAIDQFAQLIYEIVQNVLPLKTVENKLKIVSQAMVGAINEVVMQRLFAEENGTDTDELGHLLNNIVVSSFANVVSD